MAKLRIIWIGKTKERYLAEGIDHYLKLLMPMARVSVVEIREEKGRQKEVAMAAEARKVLKQTADYFVLDEKGKELTSVELARFLANRESIDFVIGGPFGLAAEIKEKARGSIALSKMTLTHEMARLLFFEQLYRAFTILMGKEYHH